MSSRKGRKGSASSGGRGAAKVVPVDISDVTDCNRWRIVFQEFQFIISQVVSQCLRWGKVVETTTDLGHRNMQDEKSKHTFVRHNSVFCTIVCMANFEKFTDYLEFMYNEIVKKNLKGVKIEEIQNRIRKLLVNAFEHDLNQMRQKNVTLTESLHRRILRYIQNTIFDEGSDEGYALIGRYVLSPSRQFSLVNTIADFYERLLDKVFEATKGKYDTIQHLKPGIKIFLDRSLMKPITKDITPQEMTKVKQNRHLLIEYLLERKLHSVLDTLYYVINLFELMIGSIEDDLGIEFLFDCIAHNVDQTIDEAVKSAHEIHKRICNELNANTIAELTEAIVSSTTLEDRPSTSAAVPKDTRREVTNFIQCIATADSKYLKTLHAARFEIDDDSVIVIEGIESDSYIEKRIQTFIEYLTENEDVFTMYVNYYNFMISTLLPVNYISEDECHGMIEFVKNNYGDFLVSVYYKMTLVPISARPRKHGKALKIKLKGSPLTFSVYNRVCDIIVFRDVILSEKTCLKQKSLNKIFAFINEVTKNAKEIFNDEYFNCELDQRKCVYAELITGNKLYTIINFVSMLYSMVFPDDMRKNSVADNLSRLEKYPEIFEDKLYYMFLLYVNSNIKNQMDIPK